MKKALTICALFLVFTKLGIGQVHAANDFASSFVSSYEVIGDGVTIVRHEISITNKSPTIYLTKYSISLGSDDIKDLVVTAQGTKAQFKKTASDLTTDLTVTIPSPVIGKGQTLNLVVSYKTATVASHYGNVWEINIPRLNKANEAETYKRQIIVPGELGDPQVATPHATSMSRNESGKLILEYIGFPSDGISLLFGTHADYKLNLVYHIKNPGPVATDTEIALPLDTEYQKVILDSIEPAPKFVKTDADGNWLAVYTLKANAEESVHATVYISVHPLPTYPSFAFSADDLIKKAKYWDVKTPEILSLAEKLKTPEFMYNYIVENFSYDFNKVGSDSERLGGAKSLENSNSAICTEFTDTFISLARSLHIPARELNGYAYTTGSFLKSGTDEDFLHAWPEYYDTSRSTWIQIDPTLGKTTGGLNYFEKLDYGHIAFVRHGIESTYPYPAGSYKSDPSEKTVEIDRTDSTPDDKIDVEVMSTGKGYTAKNKGNVALRDYALKLPDGAIENLTYLPPLGVAEVSGKRGGESGIFAAIKNFIRRLYSRAF